MDLILEEIIKETYMNVCEERPYKYKKLKDDDFENIAENIVENDEFWNCIDNFILDELQNYEIMRLNKGRE